MQLQLPMLTVYEGLRIVPVLIPLNSGLDIHSSEHVTLAALDAGISFQEMRSWGSVFTQAAKDGYIRRSDVLFSRSMGNGSLAPGWVGC